MTMHRGWYQVAFSSAVVGSMTEVATAETTIALIRREGMPLAAIDAFCPHRGANLCRGGTVRDANIICPFHGFEVSIDSRGRYCVKRFDCLEVDGLVFVKFDARASESLPEQLAILKNDHAFVPGFEMVVSAPAELVIENAFDQNHFRTVHRVLNSPIFKTASGPARTYSVRGEFKIPASRWQNATMGNDVVIPYTATAYSPTVVISHLGGERPYAMLTSAQPLAPRRSLVRLSLLVPRRNNLPHHEDCAYLLTQAKKGIEQDAIIWEAMAIKERFNPAEGDDVVIGFRKFCREYDGLCDFDESITDLSAQFL